MSGTEGKTVIVCEYCGVESKTSMTTPEAFARYAADAAELQPKIEGLVKKMEDAIGRGENKLAVRYYEGMIRLQMRAQQQLVDPEVLEQQIVSPVQQFASNMGVAWVPPSARGKLGRVEDLRDAEGRMVAPELDFMSSLRSDPRGNLVVTSSNTVLRFSSSGEYLGAIKGDLRLSAIEPLNTRTLRKGEKA